MQARPRRAFALAFALGIVTLGVATGSERATAASTPTFRLAPRASGALSGRVFTAAAGDADGSSVVVYGGENPGNVADKMFADTWVYTPGSGWAARCGSTGVGASAPCGPGPRSSAAMATGPDGPILFGGSPTGIDGGGSAPLSDTWRWSHGAWTQVCADNACGPSGRLFPGMGGNGHQVVLFGGLTGSGPADDTWVFDGSSWTQTCGTGVPTACGVPGRLGATIGWDGHEFVMFGGAPQGASDIGAPTDDTWTFDGSSWTHVCGTSIGRPCGPGPRALAATAWLRQTAATRQGAVLAGGGNLFTGAAQSLDRDVWMFRAGAWTQLPTPWAATEVHFTDGDQPPTGSGPLLPFVAAQPAQCQILFVGQDPIRNPDFAVTPQTASGGWDLTGNGQPSDCTTDPAGTPVTSPAADANPTSTAAPVAAATQSASGTSASTASMARTGSSSGWLAAVGAMAIAVGLVAIAGARSRGARLTSYSSAASASGSIGSR